jgi:hypothetical protein
VTTEKVGPVTYVTTEKFGPVTYVTTEKFDVCETETFDRSTGVRETETFKGGIPNNRVELVHTLDIRCVATIIPQLPHVGVLLSPPWPACSRSHVRELPPAVLFLPRDMCDQPDSRFDQHLFFCSHPPMKASSHTKAFSTTKDDERKRRRGEQDKLRLAQELVKLDDVAGWEELSADAHTALCTKYPQGMSLPPRLVCSHTDSFAPTLTRLLPH